MCTQRLLNESKDSVLQLDTPMAVLLELISFIYCGACSVLSQDTAKPEAEDAKQVKPLHESCQDITLQLFHAADRCVVCWFLNSTKRAGLGCRSWLTCARSACFGKAVAPAFRLRMGR